MTYDPQRNATKPTEPQDHTHVPVVSKLSRALSELLRSPHSAPAHKSSADTLPLSAQEKECVNHAAQEALFTGLAPTDAEIRLGDHFQALQQQDGLTQAVLAHKELNPYRIRAHSNEELSAQQAAALIAQERHMSHYLKGAVRDAIAERRRAQRQRQAEDQQFLDDIMIRAQGSADVRTGPYYQEATPENEDTMTDAAYDPAISDEERQGGLGSNFDRAQHAGLLRTAPKARRASPVFAYLSPHDASTTKAASETTAVLPGTINANPIGSASASITTTQAATTFDLSSAPATDAMVSTTATSSLETTSGTGSDEGTESADSLKNASNPAPDAEANTAKDDRAVSALFESTSGTDTGSVLDYELPEQLKAVATTLPPDFARQALHYETCLALVAPVLVEVRAREDEILGPRYEHKRESQNSLYQLEEVIFGTGFHISERRKHLMLEFLTVLASQNQAHPFDLTQSERYGRFAFFKRRNLRLRQILFNSPELGIIAAKNHISEEKWHLWYEAFARHNNWHGVMPEERRRGRPRTKDKTPEDEVVAVQNVPTTPLPLEQQFAQLQQTCGDFERLVTLVKVLRSWSIDSDTERQWCTKFLFPFGYDALFWEIDQYASLKQNIMSGAGQNVFSMLARALAHQGAQSDPDAAPAGATAAGAVGAASADLGLHLVQRFFTDSNGLNLGASLIGGSKLLPWQNSSDFAALLEVREQETLTKLQHAESFEQRKQYDNDAIKIVIAATRYLPYRHLPRFDLLLEDFEALSRLDLTKQELFLALGSLGSLHQICYLLEQECKVLALPYSGAELKPRDLNMVVVVNPDIKTDGIRALSMRRLKENSALFTQARSHYVQAHLRALVQTCAPELLLAPTLSEDEQVLVCNLMRCAFDFSKNFHINLKERTITETNNKGTDTQLKNITISPDGISYAEIEEMLCTHERDMHMKGLHQNWGADIGLITKEKAVTYFYSLSDELLYYLVLALVPKGQPMALKDFLQKLHQRYYLVIGPHEAQSAHYALEDRVFIDNERQFKLKLSRNHLLISLSDACDYVRNPFS